MNIMKLIENISVLFILALPPWIVLIKRTKKRKTKKQRETLLIIFIIYIIITCFTKNILPTILAVIYMIYVYKKMHNSKEAYYLRPFNKKTFKFEFKGKSIDTKISREVVIIIFLSILFKIIISIISLWYTFILTKLGIESQEQSIIFEILGSSTLKTIYLIIIAIICAPILEEFIFRHLFYRYMKNKIGIVGSTIVSSGIFSMLHYNIVSVVALFSLGIMNCILYEKKGYRAAVLNHFIFNVTSLITILIIKKSI